MFQVYLPTQVTANCSMRFVHNFAWAPRGWEAAWWSCFAGAAHFPTPHLPSTALSCLWSSSGRGDGSTAGREALQKVHKEKPCRELSCLFETSHSRTFCWAGKKKGHLTFFFIFIFKLYLIYIRLCTFPGSSNRPAESPWQKPVSRQIWVFRSKISKTL